MSEIVIEILLYILVYALAFPVVGVLSTPVILIIAIWGEDSYFANVKAYYKRVFKWLTKVIDKWG